MKEKKDFCIPVHTPNHSKQIERSYEIGEPMLICHRMSEKIWRDDIKEKTEYNLFVSFKQQIDPDWIPVWFAKEDAYFGKIWHYVKGYFSDDMGKYLCNLLSQYLEKGHSMNVWIKLEER